MPKRKGYGENLPQKISLNISLHKKYYPKIQYFLNRDVRGLTKFNFIGPPKWPTMQKGCTMRFLFDAHFNLMNMDKIVYTFHT